MKRIVALCVVFAMFWTTLAIGQDQKAVPLSKGDPAPYDGVLIPPPRLEELIGAEIERDKLKIRLETFQRIKKVEIEAYENALKSKSKWYKDPQLNRIGGFIFGVLVAGVAVYGAGQLD